MKKRIVGFSVLFLVIFLLQTSAVFAAKPTKTSVQFSVLFEDGEQLEFIEKSRMDIKKYRSWGIVEGDLDGTFVWLSTSTTRYATTDKDEIVFTKSSAEVTVECMIGAKTGTLILSTAAIVKYPPVYPTMGTWRIIDGTGDFAGLRGNGEYSVLNGFVFEGTIVGL